MSDGHGLKLALKRACRPLILHVAKSFGLFRLARHLTRGGLRILCYHGGSFADEHRFSPGTHMTAETFRSRMAVIARQGYSVLSLDDAIRHLERGTLPEGSIVITIDDGWLSTYSTLVPVLKDFEFPSTLYVTTYYVIKETANFDMLVGYLLWKSYGRMLDLGRLGNGLEGVFDLGDADDARDAFGRIRACANTALDAAGREKLAIRIGEELGYDSTEIRDRGVFRLVDRMQIAELIADGVDIQLHTHRHRMPIGRPEEIERELSDNAAVLEPLAGKSLTHFCYPSGVHDRSVLPVLADFGIRTATTVEPGFCYGDTNRLLIPRILDSEALSPIEFEAEICGFIEITRRLRSGARRQQHRDAVTAPKTTENAA